MPTETSAPTGPAVAAPIAAYDATPTVVAVAFYIVLSSVNFPTAIPAAVSAKSATKYEHVPIFPTVVTLLATVFTILSVILFYIFCLLTEMAVSTIESLATFTVGFLPHSLQFI